MTPKQEAALRQALEFIEANTYGGDDVVQLMTTIREELAEQPAQEPVAWEGKTSVEYPVGTPRLIFTDKQRADEWLAGFVDGAAWLEPLYTSPPASKPCEWQREDDIHMPDTWRSECGVLWTFTDGGPVENDMKHCCGCGAKLKEKNA